MLSVGTAIAVALVGAVLGYFFRAFEFRRDQRLRAYADVLAAFMRVSRAGTHLTTGWLVRGRLMYAPEHRAEFNANWNAWVAALQSFEEAVARVRMIGSDRARSASEELEDFITTNILSVGPFNTEKTTGRDVGMAENPPEVGKAAAALARTFADNIRSDVQSRFLPR